jgi:DNA-binding MarR family transcriptional regulator
MLEGYAEYFRALVRHETDLWNVIEHHMAGAGATSLGRLRALQVIESMDRCRVQDIAAGLRITVGATSRLVDRLANDGLVSRSHNPEDRRSLLIALTADGRREIEEAQPLFEAALTTALAPVTGEELAVLAAQLDRVNAATTGAIQTEVL